ncbi:C2H2-like zinc finger protein [Actinidia rufa]|uniref:C2H2-like zinc finger protein n=1 Tax=Actinidia rufa TaxID=165716 RepID=A0A7J0GFS6_9ERIC|nr:C2H2-like zinc finger protein [Actinidia rufa]
MAKTKSPKKNTKKSPQNQNQNAPKPEKPPSWEVLRSLLTCKHLQAQLQPPQKPNEMQKPEQPTEENIKKCKKMTCSGSLCSNTKVMHRPEQSLSSPEDKKKRASMGTASTNNNGSNSSRSLKAPLNELRGAIVSSSASTSNSSMLLSFGSSSNAGSFRGMPFRRFSGCYECRMVVDPVLGFSRDPSLRATICSCPQCGEIFMKAENLELHQAVRHAVSELGPEDTSKNIVEIIFQSSWLKKQSPICKIDRILKVQNTPKTIAKFEEYRDSVKAKSVKLPRSTPAARPTATSSSASTPPPLPAPSASTAPPTSAIRSPNCSVCRIIKNGFRVSAGRKGF